MNTSGDNGIVDLNRRDIKCDVEPLEELIFFYAALQQWFSNYGACNNSGASAASSGGTCAASKLSCLVVGGETDVFGDSTQYNKYGPRPLLNMRKVPHRYHHQTKCHQQPD